MQVLNVSFLAILTWIAVIDFKSFKVPLFGLCAIVALIFIKYPSLKYFTMSSQFANDVVNGMITMIASLFIGDWIMKRETLGGGDVWLGVAMSAFMGFDKFLFAYTVAALLGMVVMMTIHRKLQCFDMAYAPYLAIGAFIAMVIK